MTNFTVDDARFPDDKPEVTRLFRDYAAWLGIDFGWQDFETELATLPGRYAPPSGALLLLRQSGSGKATGCIAMRGLENGDCEMKRLYLELGARGQGQGARLVEAIIDRARAAGYRRMVLDTLDHMGAALKLYDRLGFQRIAPYYHNPLPGAVYRGLDL